MSLEVLLAVYCLLIVFASVAGGHLASLIQMTHLRTQLLMSFVGGLMLGIAMLHLLPHASEILGSPSQTGIAALTGVVAMFLLLRAFHPHQHGHAIGDPHVHPQPLHESQPHDHHHSEYSHEHAADQHPHEHAADQHAEGCSHQTPRGMGWIGMLFGLGLHTLIDGVALAASALADSQHGSWLGLAGLGTFLAVALHKPLDAFAITSTMKTSGWAVKHQNIANFAFSMACPLGALLFYFGFTQLSQSTILLGWGLAISGGFFICIALSDLLPEVAFHDHDRIILTAALLVGISLAVAIESLPGHRHNHEDHDHPPVTAQPLIP